MKKAIIACLSLLWAVSAFAQDTTAKGTVFTQGTLKELLAQAGKQEKYLFVDVYAGWCGPCRYMATKIFPQPKVGDYFNKTFVNAKFDAEKGEGIAVARKYDVRSYPTFLILDEKGEEVGRVVGAADADRFIATVQKVVAAIGKEE